MSVWRKSKAFMHLLEYRQNILSGKVSRVQDQIKRLENALQQYRAEQQQLKKAIREALVVGENISRQDIYSGIRLQGRLLNRQNYILSEIKQLEEEMHDQEHELSGYVAEKNILSKREHKFRQHFQKVRKEMLLMADIRAENEIEDRVNYG